MKYTWLSIALLAAGAFAQDCPDVGSHRVPGYWEDGPPLGCPGAPAAPAWKLYTPPHRVAVPRVGYRLGDARERARILVRFECTGWPAYPVRVVEVRTIGYVLSVEQERCRPRPAAASESPDG